MKTNFLDFSPDEKFCVIFVDFPEEKEIRVRVMTSTRASQQNYCKLGGNDSVLYCLLFVSARACKKAGIFKNNEVNKKHR